MQTDKQINDAVNRVATVCGNSHTWMMQYENKSTKCDHYKCILCCEFVSVPHGASPPETQDIEVPDYVTDPRLWWPLAEELIKVGHCISWWKQEEMYVDAIVTDPPCCPGYACLALETAWHEQPGRAVCLAYLKMKGD